MEFLRVARRKSLLSESVYVLLNIALAVAVLTVIWATSSPLPALALVFLSKWRVFAVRPRYWFAHLQANMVDFIVSVSFVILLYVAGSTESHTAGVVTQVVLTILYALWLLALKPRARRKLVVLQAGVAVLFGVASLFMVAYAWPSSVVVVSMWLIGYSCARHVLAAYSEEQLVFFSILWGLVFAELGWLAYHWTFAFNLVFAPGIEVAGIALICILLSFVAERVYSSYFHHNTIRSIDVALPLIFAFSTTAILLVADIIRTQSSL